MSEESPAAEPRPPIQHFYSATAGGFYASDMHAPDEMPGDAKALPAELYHSLFIGQGEGRPIIAGPDGMPMLGDLPVASAEQIQANLRVQRTILLAQSDWTQMSDSPLPPATKTAWATYRQALRDYPAGKAGADWPTPPGK